MLKFICRSSSYVLWLLFCIVLFSILTLGLIIPFYLVFIIIAILPSAEELWRVVNGIRPLRIFAEKERLQPLLKEVYVTYRKYRKETHTQDIQLHIQESMEINAFAFGRETLVLTKGAIDLLGDDELKGLIAHELWHFHNYDTLVALFSWVANFPMVFLMKKLHRINDSLEAGITKFLFNVVFIVFRFIEFIGDLILMRQSRYQETLADALAMKMGYGKELTGALIQIYQISMEKPKSITEMLKATHPPITERIDLLETYMYQSQLKELNRATCITDYWEM